MSFLKNIFWVYFALCLAYSQSGFAVCKLCEKIREANAKKTNPYEYYEDYLEAKEKGEVDEIDFSDKEDDESSK